MGGGKTVTVDACIRFHARNTPSKLAVADARIKLTYAELDERIDQVMALFRHHGLRKGDRIAVLLRNRIEWAEILFACARSGVICVPVNSRFMANEVAHVVTHAQATAIITEQSLGARIDAIRD